MHDLMLILFNLGSNHTSFTYSIMHYDNQDPLKQSIQCHFYSREYSSCVVVVYLASIQRPSNLRTYNASRFGNKAVVNVTLDSLYDNLLVLPYDEKTGIVAQGLGTDSQHLQLVDYCKLAEFCCRMFYQK